MVAVALAALFHAWFRPAANLCAAEVFHGSCGLDLPCERVFQFGGNWEVVDGDGVNLSR